MRELCATLVNTGLLELQSTGKRPIVGHRCAAESSPPRNDLSQGHDFTRVHLDA
jgi:hypothetical protein